MCSESFGTLINSIVLIIRPHNERCGLNPSYPPRGPGWNLLADLKKGFERGTDTKTYVSTKEAIRLIQPQQRCSRSPSCSCWLYDNPRGVLQTVLVNKYQKQNTRDGESAVMKTSGRACLLCNSMRKFVQAQTPSHVSLLTLLPSRPVTPAVSLPLRAPIHSSFALIYTPFSPLPYVPRSSTPWQSPPLAPSPSGTLSALMD